MTDAQYDGEDTNDGCPQDRSACYAEDDISGTDCVFVKECFFASKNSNLSKGENKK